MWQRTTTRVSVSPHTLGVATRRSQARLCLPSVPGWDSGRQYRVHATCPRPLLDRSPAGSPIPPRRQGLSPSNVIISGFKTASSHSRQTCRQRVVRCLTNGGDASPLQRLLERGSTINDVIGRPCFLVRSGLTRFAPGKLVPLSAEWVSRPPPCGRCDRRCFPERAADVLGFSMHLYACGAPFPSPGGSFLF